MFNACIDSSNVVVTYLHVLFITIRKYLQQYGISTYIHAISHGHIIAVSYHIVRVSHCKENVRTVIARRIHPCVPCDTLFPLLSKCAYGNIQAYKPCMYHIGCVSQCWSIFSCSPHIMLSRMRNRMLLIHSPYNHCKTHGNHCSSMGLVNGSTNYLLVCIFLIYTTLLATCSLTK